MHKITISLVAAFILTGCSSTTPIQRADQSESGFGSVYNGYTSVLREDIPDSEAYRVFNKGASGFVPLSAVRENAEKRAKDFCGRKSQVVDLVRETTSVGPHILGNFPRIEIVFACIDSKNEFGNEHASGSYSKLRELKSLLDDGLITQQEYDKGKTRILSQ
jgi:uncharacterized protein YceK